ncbi:hypothetical protein [Paenibacillus hamazuiensis]|uniref:hypothetical protein n=1 Tax=Paenibacillus hamazuiensis TaxID=2936508 RepID=UPI00200F2400|nr:hypothetical protein [Paenibacillus hamazuiensis]
MLFAPVTINVLGYKVNAIDHSATLNMGPSQHIDTFVSYKRSQGIGEQNGDASPMFMSLSWVTDSDLIDTPTGKISLL